MDTSIIGVALPKPPADRGLDPQDLSWPISADVVAFVGPLLRGGRLSDLFGCPRTAAARRATSLTAVVSASTVHSTARALLQDGAHP